MEEILFVNNCNDYYSVVCSASAVSLLYNKIWDTSTDKRLDFYLGRMITNYGTTKFLHDVSIDRKDPATILQEHIRTTLVKDHIYRIDSNDMRGDYIMLNPEIYPDYCTGYEYYELKEALGIEDRE